MYIHVFNHRHNAGNAFFTSIQCSRCCQYEIKGLMSSIMKMVAIQQSCKRNSREENWKLMIDPHKKPGCLCSLTEVRQIGWTRLESPFKLGNYYICKNHIPFFPLNPPPPPPLSLPYSNSAAPGHHLLTALLHMSNGLFCQIPHHSNPPQPPLLPIQVPLDFKVSSVTI